MESIGIMVDESGLLKLSIHKKGISDRSISNCKLIPMFITFRVQKSNSFRNYLFKLAKDLVA